MSNANHILLIVPRSPVTGKRVSVVLVFYATIYYMSSKPMLEYFYCSKNGKSEMTLSCSH